MGGQLVMGRRSKYAWFTCAALLCGGATCLAQPQPGDVYREYRWTNTGGDAGGSLRVGGRFDYGKGSIETPHEFDLTYATRAEVVIEKLLCHDKTRGLAISVNHNDWITMPEAAGIAEPAWDYQHHIYPVASVPLAHLRPGGGNEFRLQVNEGPPPNWPQNLVYGVHFRVYYDGAKKPHPAGRLLAPTNNSTLGLESELVAESGAPGGDVQRVDFLGCYEDINLEGDGQYTQWHYHYVKAQLAGHLGTATTQPWKMTWNASWVPDQPKPFQLAALITDGTGLTYFTEPTVGLTFERGGRSVELCKPYGVPERWVTRVGEKQESFRVTGDLSKAVAAKFVWCSWSPGYMEGLFVNGKKVFDAEGPRYAYFVHHVRLQDLAVLKQGENTLMTGKTPKYGGKMVHGMEVNWPGIMVLIQYERDIQKED